MIFLYTYVCFVETLLLSLSCVLFGMFVLAIQLLRLAQIRLDGVVYKTTVI